MEQILPPDLSGVVHYALKSSQSLVETLEEPREHGPPGNGLDPEHIRRIIEAILWHRRFILTYYVVLGSVVAVSCSSTLYQRFSRWYRKRKATTTEELPTKSLQSGASSSSSTLRGTITPPVKDDTEDTPLLRQKLIPQSRPPFLHRLRAFLLYQPRPIHALTSRVNVLPDTATTISIILFAVLNLFYLFYRAPLRLEWVFIVADRAGLLFVVNLPVLYLLAAKTNQPIKLLTGWSYEGLNMFHRRLGEWMIIFSVVHMFGMLLVFWTILRPLGYTLYIYFTSPTVYLGIVAILSYFIIYGTSTGWFRQMYYEAFLGLHIVFQVAALVFLFFHYPTAKPYVVATFLIWAIDRLVWRSTLSNRKFIATLEVAPDEKTILVHCDIDLQQKIFGIRAGLHHGWLPGQHLFLTIPSMGFKHRFQTHPFTIASPAPPKNSKVASWPLQLVIRSIDGFSLDLLNYARHHQHCEVILEGPHGGMEALEAAHRADRVCFVAGGSGIAVTYPLAWDHQIKERNQADALINLRTRYENGVKHVPAVLEYSSLLDKTKFGHFWVRQDPRHNKWISIVPTAKALDPIASTIKLDEGGMFNENGMEEVATLITHTFDTRRPGPDGGRPDMKSELWDWVTSTSISTSSSSTALNGQVSEDSSICSSRQQSFKTVKERQRERICIVVSGPDGLVRDIRNVVAQLVGQGWNVEVWVEKFGW